MGKFIGLIKNEFTKQYKKISIVVLTALLLIFAMGMPFLFKYMENRDFNTSYYLENYKHQISNYTMEMESLKNKTDDISKLTAKTIQLNIDYTNFLLDNKIGYGEWRKEVVDLTLQKQATILAIESLLDNYSEDNILKVIYLVDPQILSEFSKLTDEELKSKKTELEKEYKTFHENLKNNDYKKYVKENLASYLSTLKELKESLKIFETELKKDSTSKVLIESVESTKIQISMQEEFIKILQYRYDNDVSSESSDWRNSTLENIAMCIPVKYEKPISEDEFKSNYSYDIQQGLTYEKHLEKHKLRVQENIEQIEINWYSLNKNMPQLGFAKDAKNAVNSTYLIYVSILVFLCVMIGGNIVSSEFSKGTIRLLISRPVSRWKLLLSKLILVTLIGYILLFISIALTTLSSGIAYGFNGLSTPILSYANNAVIEQSFFSYIMPSLLFASISLIFAISLAFTISTLIKNTALAVGLTIFLYLSGLTASMFMAQLKMTWVAYTPLPYINLSNVLPESYVLSNFREAFGVELLPNLGAIELVVLSIVLIIVSFLVFNKQDVKN
ncbi:MAG: ABC transporter permease subunit [Clostridium sp.]